MVLVSDPVFCRTDTIKPSSWLWKHALKVATEENVKPEDVYASEFCSSRQAWMTLN
jgi:hypothetical protein